jgi:hypothetical protein
VDEAKELGFIFRSDSLQFSLLRSPREQGLDHEEDKHRADHERREIHQQAPDPTSNAIPWINGVMTDRIGYDNYETDVDDRQKNHNTCHRRQARLVEK